MPPPERAIPPVGKGLRRGVPHPWGQNVSVSLLLYLEPAVSVVAAAVFLGEHVTLAKAGGGLLILAGVAVASTSRDGATPRQTGQSMPTASTGAHNE